MNFEEYKEPPMDHSVVLSDTLRKGQLSLAEDGSPRAQEQRGGVGLSLVRTPSANWFREKITALESERFRFSSEFCHLLYLQAYSVCNLNTYILHII